MDLYLINLRRRSDRLAVITSHLNERGLHPAIVEASDARLAAPLDRPTFIATPESCCWHSHTLAMRAFLATDQRYAMILEDDCILDPSVDWPRFMDDVAVEMGKWGVSFLQIGYISALYTKSDFASKALDFYRQSKRRYRESRWTFLADGERRNAILGESRSGAHCYVVDRAFAKGAPAFNQPAWAHTDDFFGFLAQAQWTKKGPLKMARLEKSLAEQISRRGKGVAPDSDVGTGEGFGS